MICTLIPNINGTVPYQQNFVSKHHLPNENANRQTRSVVDVSAGDQQKLRNFNSTIYYEGKGCDYKRHNELTSFLKPIIPKIVIII